MKSIDFFKRRYSSSLVSEIKKKLQHYILEIYFFIIILTNTTTNVCNFVKSYKYNNVRVKL